MKWNEFLETNYPNRFFCDDCNKSVDAYFLEQHSSVVYINLLCHGQDWISAIELEQETEK